MQIPLREYGRSLGAVRRQVCITFSLILVKLDQVVAFLSRQQSVLYPLHHAASELVVELNSVKAHNSQRVRKGGTINDLLDNMTVVAYKDVSFVRHSEEIMVVSHNFLISANQHHCQVIRLPLDQFV